MIIKSMISLVLILLLGLSTLFTNIIYSYATTTTETKAEFTSIKETDNGFTGTIKYNLKSETEVLSINSSDISKFDLDILKKQLGNKNVTLQKNQNNILLNLKEHVDKSLNGEFDFKINKIDSITISITDSKNNFLASKKLDVEAKLPTMESVLTNNADEKDKSKNNLTDINTVDETKEKAAAQDDDQDDTNWTQTYNLRLSRGPTLEHASGSKATPFLYFGDFFYARKQMLVKDAYQKDTGRGKDGRFDSLTAPNFATVVQPEGDNEELNTIDDGEKGDNDVGKEFITKGRHIYTHNNGDGQHKDNVTGSKGTFVTTDLHNYNHVTDHKTMPSMMGPDHLGSTVAMLTIPKLFYKLDPQTGFEQQKLIFQQQYVAGKIKYKLEMTIIIKFNRSGEMVTEVSYKNIGDKEFKNFIGFVFHNIAFNRDYVQEYDKDKKIYHGGYVPLRSLGNNRGMYAQSDSVHARVNFHMNLDNEPEAWAARTTTDSSHQFKGYTSSGGILSLVFTGILQAKFTGNPWKHHMNDRYNHTPWYQPGNLPKGMFNSFRTYEDPGDKGHDPGAGKKLGRIYGKKDFGAYIDENTYLWDAGVTMRTEPTTLEVDDSKTIRYSRTFDIMDEKFAPVIILDQNGTKDKPDNIEAGQTDYKLTGSWYDFDSESGDLFWTMDDENPDKKKKKINTYSQNDKDKTSGVPHDWNETISIQKYKPGLHTVNVWMVDSEGNKSIVQTTTINIAKAPTNEPQIIIANPYSTEASPFAPNGDTINLKGYWTDLNSPTIKEISYSIDDNPENIITTNLSNPNLGKEVNWEIPQVNISHLTDLKLHKIIVNIYDDDGLNGSDILYFQRKEGTCRLTAPTEIDFGKHFLDGKNTSKIHPQFENKLEVDDYRANTGKPMKLTLHINKFINSEYEQMKLNHCVYWEGQQCATNDLPIGVSNNPKDGTWLTKTDFTDLIKQKLSLVFQFDGLPKAGEFNSKWDWILTDAP
ncbi:hypothetical protein [Companilactobacillus hulinensis]|uniref:hypothetical protein n=1 Tax=Companilactobacillus hulinensis TaxID=2486007 RepID=UPI000F76B5B2|nr:hypothetical protein [Companilactobacillus hulinensis]